MTTKAEQSGGQVALIGFLYQIVGTLALRAWASMPHPPDESGDLEALLVVIGRGDLHHEAHDIDAMVRALGFAEEDACVLLQFKFSHDPSRYPLTPGDLGDICKRFQENVEKWPSERLAITNYRVLTNRPISTTLKPILRRPAGQRSHKRFDTPGLVDMLQEVEVISDLTIEMFSNRLALFAAQYGTRQEEFVSGVHKLIGSLVAYAALNNTPVIAVNNLAAAFRGFPDPMQLVARQVCQSTNPARQRQVDRLGVPGFPGLPIRRKLLDDLRAAIGQTGFIVLTGDGGNGKSVLAWQMIDEILRDAGSGSGSLAAFLEPHQVEPDPLSWLVGEWQHAPEDRRHETMTIAFERIQVANPGATPAICLAIDGLDEIAAIHGHEVGIKRAVDWFWEHEQERGEHKTATVSVPTLPAPPASVLVVTCRDEEKVREPWLGGELSHALRTHPPFSLPVGEFSEEELLEAAEQLMPDQRSQVATAFRSSALKTNAATGSGPVIHSDISSILTHPAMWYAMYALDDAQRVGVLIGELASLDALADKFMHWFVTKVIRRRPEWGREDVLDALKRVASLAGATNVSQFAYDLWKQPAVGEQVLVGSQRLRLYNEALSAGVIGEAERRKTWYWRHPLVGRRLAQLAEEEA